MNCRQHPSALIISLLSFQYQIFPEFRMMWQNVMIIVLMGVHTSQKLHNEHCTVKSSSWFCVWDPMTQFNPNPICIYINIKHIRFSPFLLIKSQSSRNWINFISKLIDGDLTTVRVLGDSQSIVFGKNSLRFSLFHFMIIITVVNYYCECVKS